VFESSLVSEGPGSEESERKPGQQVSAKFFGMTVQDLTGDLISHFDLPDAQGVLVSEVEGKSGAGRLQRGDVIMAVKGEKVRDIAELRQKLGQEEGHVVTVRVRRDGQDVNVPLSITNTEMSQRKEESE
jgi:S1-C subfamily serine protease